jgi:hypothetical protein
VSYHDLQEWTRWDAHGEAVGTVPGATITSIGFALETHREIGGFASEPIEVRTGPNDAYTYSRLPTPYYGGPPSTTGTIPVPTGRCIVRATDRFGKITTETW